LGETDLHRDITWYLIEALKLRFHASDGVYVSGDLMMYYVEGNPRVSISPDVFVVKGAAQFRRRVYKVWAEPAPCVVIEVSSRKTKAEDLVTKFQVYRDVLRIREYYIYDPERDYLPGRMRGWVLRAGQYVERRVVNGRLRSRELGLDLVDDRGFMKLADPGTGEILPGLRESEDARRWAESERQRAESDLERTRVENRLLKEQLEQARRRGRHRS
jgi:Uma2 family endonuclease